MLPPAQEAPRGPWLLEHVRQRCCGKTEGGHHILERPGAPVEEGRGAPHDRGREGRRRGRRRGKRATPGSPGRTVTSARRTGASGEGAGAGTSTSASSGASSCDADAPIATSTARRSLKVCKRKIKEASSSKVGAGLGSALPTRLWRAAPACAPGGDPPCVALWACLRRSGFMEPALR